MQVVYSEGVHRLLADSQEAAGRFRHRFVHTEHLLMGLLSERSSGTRLLKSLGFDRHELKKECESRSKRGDHTMQENRKLTQRVQEIMAVSKMKMTEMGHEELDTRHILLGILFEPEGIAGKVLREAGLSVQAFEAAIRADSAVTEDTVAPTVRRRRSHRAAPRPVWKRLLRVG